MVSNRLELEAAAVELLTAPATEAILGTVPTEKAGVGPAANDATPRRGTRRAVGALAASPSPSRGSPRG